MNSLLSRHRQPTLIILIVAVLVYSVFFSAYQIQRHRAFHTSLDLVSVEQPLWNTLHGNFMRTTYYPITGQEMSRFDQTPSEILLADHFQPSILTLLLPYILFPYSETLMILVSVCVALGAIPLYRITLRRLENPWGLIFSMAYLLLPIVQTNTSHDIHLVNFVPPLLLFALDAMERGATRQWLVFSLLAMGCREDMLLLVGWGMLFYAPRPKRHLAFYLFVAGILIGIVFYGVIAPNFGGPGSESTYLSRMLPSGTELSWQGILHVMSQAKYWKSVFIHTLSYHFRLGLPVLFLYGLHVPSLLAAAPLLVQNSLSWWPIQWDPGSAHYSAPIVPYILIGSAEGLRCLAHQLRRFRNDYQWQSVIGVAMFTSIIVVQWMAGYTPLSRSFQWPVINGREAALQKILEEIPVEANLSAESHLAGHLARRPMLRFFPDTRNADWLLLDVWMGHYPFYTGYETTLRTWQNALTSSDWETVNAQNGVVLLRKGHGPPKGLAAAFTPVSAFSLHAMNIHFTDKSNEIGLIGARFIPMGTNQYALCTDWEVSSSELTPTIKILEPVLQTQGPLSGLLFYPDLFSYPRTIRDCSPLLLASPFPLKIGLEVKNQKGLPLKVEVIEDGGWVQVIDNQVVLPQSSP